MHHTKDAPACALPTPGAKETCAAPHCGFPEPDTIRLPLRAAPPGDLQGAGRRPCPYDRAHRRQLHQHPDHQALCPYPPRARLCPRRHGRLHGHRPPADAPRHQADRRAPDRQRAPPRRHRRARHLRLVCGDDHRRCDRARHAHPGDVRLGALGDRRPLREYRHRSGRHEHHRPAAAGRWSVGRPRPRRDGARSSSTASPSITDVRAA
jgi:hypothetical protein